GCVNAPVVTPVPDINTSDNSTATRYDYDNCQGNSAIAFYKVQNGAHTWPGASLNIGVTNQDFSASLEIWKFFLQHPHPDFLVNTPEWVAHEKIKVYPNPTNEKLHIQLNNQSGSTTAELMDLSGKVFLTQMVSDFDFIEMSNIPNGVYLLSLKSESGVQVKKVIKN